MRTQLIYGILVVVFSFYSLFLFSLTHSILEKNRPGWLLRFLFMVVNDMLAFATLLLPSATSSYSYILLFLVLFSEFLILYRDSFPKCLFCAASALLHVMAIRSLCTALFSLNCAYSVYEIAHNETSLLISMIVSFFLLDLALLCVKWFVSIKKLKILCQHSTLLWFMTAWIMVFNFYFFINANVYSQPQNHPIITMNQIAAPISILLGFYVLFFFSFRTSALLGYEEKSKELELAITKEQQYRESMTKDSLMTYEFNLTQNILIKGAEQYLNGLGSTPPYSDMLLLLAKKLQHPEDWDRVPQTRELLLAQYEAGTTEIVNEYRRLMPTGEYCWVRAITNLVEDPDTGDIKGLTYIKNIDREKKLQFELRYKSEHDSLTKLYNRGAIAALVAEHITLEKEQNGALFIIDVDNFKSINDTFGHIYGDAVLSELSAKLSYVFEQDGIVGRIGGDEFIAYMKYPSHVDEVIARAKEVCAAFRSDYMCETVQCVRVSASIGVALYPLHGNSFEVLYQNADIALYSVKSHGKNNYRLFEPQAFEPHEMKRTAIDTMGVSTQKSFKENRIEYVFKILYASDKPTLAICSVLELVTKHFGFDRGYIFETDQDGKTTSNTFEWCKDRVTPQIQNLQKLPIESVQTATASFYKTGQFLLECLDTLPPSERAVLEPQGIQSMFQFGLFEKERLLGFIGFDHCSAEKSHSQDEIDEILTICNILATFFVKQRMTEELTARFSALSAAMNSLDSYAYVVKRDSYQVAFMNAKTAQLVGNLSGDIVCYRDFRGFNAPCPDCPIPGLSNDSKDRCVREIYNDRFHIWTETSASHLRWIGDEPSFFINCADIHRYKNSSQEHH